MNKQTKIGLEIIQLAVVMGLLGDVLLRRTPWGLNVLLFNLAFVGAVILLLRRFAADRLTGQTFALLAAQMFFASMFVWRDAIELRVADTFAIIAILGVLFLPTLSVSARVAGMFHYIVGVVWAGLNSLFAPVALLASDVGWSELSTSGWRKHALAVLRSLLIATPLMLIFGALFMAADTVYDGWVRKLLNVDFEIIFSHGILFTIFAWLTAGYLRGVMFASVASPAAASLSIIDAVADEKHESKVDQFRAESGEHAIGLPDNKTVVEHINSPDSPEKKTETPVDKSESASSEPKPSWSWANINNSIVPGATLGTVEIGVIFGLINLLFLSFVIFQVPYLFGGMELVQNTPDFKLADYARRGFGELVAVSAIVLPMLLVSHWLIRKETRAAENLFRVLAGVQIALLFVIMASAVQRLVLLTGNLGYGLTTVRLYPLIFMTWLAIVFVLFAATVLRGFRQHFAWAALWSAFLVLGATHVLNPDELIVRHNIALMREGREFDANYNGRLSDDAIPELIEAFPDMSESNQQIVVRELAWRNCRKKEERGIRSWNYSRQATSPVLSQFDEQFSKVVSKCAWHDD